MLDYNGGRPSVWHLLHGRAPLVVVGRLVATGSAADLVGEPMQHSPPTQTYGRSPRQGC